MGNVISTLDGGVEIVGKFNKLLESLFRKRGYDKTIIDITAKIFRDKSIIERENLTFKVPHEERGLNWGPFQ